MKVVSPIVALATLASGASAAVDNKDGASRPKRRTIFHNHKADDGSAEGEPDAGTDGRKRRQPGMNKMEKATKVNANRIIERGLAMHRAAKKKEKEAAAAAAAAEGDEGRTLEGANPSGSSAAADAPPGAATPLRSAEDADERETRTPAPATAPATAPAVTDKTPTAASGAVLHGSGHAASFGFEEWEAQELMKNRRRDRGFEFEQKPGRRRFAEEQMYGRRTTKTSDGDEKRGRRTASVAERKPNPRPVPRKSSASGKDRDFDERRRQRRDLRPDAAAPDSAKPGISGRDDERRDLKKSKKYSKSSKSKGGKSGDPNEGRCVVRLTNLTKEQWFSDIFWMVHSDKVEQPLWEFGLPAFDDLADLAQNGNPEPLIDFFDDNDDGVLAVDAERGPLMEGDSLFFDVPRSGSYDLFTMATSFIFSNDGFVSIDAGEIKDGAVWFLWGLDAGVEANTQLCWTVQATSADFPPNSDCFGVRDNVADQNDNGFFGEGFVFVHNGIHDFGNRNDLEDFLAFTCDELNANSFVTYFQALGFDDGVLLYDDDRERNEKDDEVFLEDLEDEFDDLIDNFQAFKIAVEAGNFRQFCRDLNEINSFLVNAFETLEPQVFDFRTPMVRVEMAC